MDNSIKPAKADKEMCASIVNQYPMWNEIRIRKFTINDFMEIREWVNNSEVTSQLMDSFIFDHFHSEEETKGFLKSAIESNDEIIRLAISNNENIYLGQISIFNIDSKVGKCEFDVVISDPRNYDQGLGLKTVLTVCNYIKKELGINEVIAKIKIENKRALKCFKKAGFEVKRSYEFHFELSINLKDS